MIQIQLFSVFVGRNRTIRHCGRDCGNHHLLYPNISKNQTASKDRMYIFPISNLEIKIIIFVKKTSKYLCNHQRNILKVTFHDQSDKIPRTSKSFEIPIPLGRYRASWLGAREHASNMLHAKYKNCKKSTLPAYNSKNIRILGGLLIKSSNRNSKVYGALRKPKWEMVL